MEKLPSVINKLVDKISRATRGKKPMVVAYFLEQSGAVQPAFGVVFYLVMDKLRGTGITCPQTHKRRTQADTSEIIKPTRKFDYCL